MNKRTLSDYRILLAEIFNSSGGLITSPSLVTPLLVHVISGLCDTRT